MSKKARRRELKQKVSKKSWINAEHQQRPWTCVVITVHHNDCNYVGMGFSKVRHPDKWDAERGKDLAYHKAVADIVRQIMVDEEC